jgi:SAM-dependent methyltransferase
MALPRHRQDELDAYYATGAYWSDAVGDSQVQNLHERNQCRHRARLALDLLRGKTDLRVLDVGAGHGWTHYWLEALRPGALAAFDFVEPDDARSHEIVARHASTPAARVPSLWQARGGYDLIFLNHVLEHVADPLICVAQVVDLLTEDGIAYFEVPHADQRFKRDVFPHTWFFTLPGLSRLAGRVGVKEVLRETFGRLPTSGAVDLLNRIAFRMSAVLGFANLAGAFDDRLWRYERSGDGIWLRWVIGRPEAGRVRRASPAG